MSGPRGAEALGQLLGSPFFEGFDPRDLADLARTATVVAFDRYERVFLQGDPATSLFLLVEGSVELRVGRPAEGPTLVVQTVIHPGYPLGWSAVVAPFTYRATATTLGRPGCWPSPRTPSGARPPSGPSSA